MIKICVVRLDREIFSGADVLKVGVIGQGDLLEASE